MTDQAPPADLPRPPGLSFTPRPVAQAAGHINSAAIIGGHKSGKTTLGASASEIPALKAAGKKVLLLESETGYASVAEDYPLAEQFSITTYQGFMRAVDELLTQPHPYGVVVLDTYDKFQSIAEEFFKTVHGTDTYGVYRSLKNWTLDMAWKLHKAPFTTIFLFHSETVKDANSGILRESFKLAGSAGDTIGEVFDLIGHLTVEADANGEAQRVLQLGPKPGYVTGNRWEKKLPSKMVNATMPEIVSIIRSTPSTQN